MEINDKLFTLKKDFSLWRSKRKRGTPVPNELKERACSLLEEEDIYRVAKACTVSKNLLDTWNKNLSEAPAEKKTQHFIELSKPLLANNELKSKKLSIELTRANGEKMMISGDIPGESLNLILGSFLSRNKGSISL